MANIGLIDDHILLRKGLAGLLTDLGYTIVLEADNGKDFIEQLQPEFLPDLVMLDINMPVMDGFETASWIKKNHPSLKILVLSMYDNEISIIRMIRLGASGYILKDIEPTELKEAIESVLINGFYYTDLVNEKLLDSINKNKKDTSSIKKIVALNDKELKFIYYACSELSYKQIADKMNVSPRTIDGYRDDLFEKMQIKTRVGLAIYAIKNNIVNI